MTSREYVFSELFIRLKSVRWNVGTEQAPNIKQFMETSRKIVLFSDAPNQPWAGQAEHSENSAQKTNLGVVRVWSASWVIYHQLGQQPGMVPATYNNLILDGVEEALRPLPNDPGYLDDRNTLSGLVHHCFISGDTLKDPGDIDGQAMLVVPIKILIP